MPLHFRSYALARRFCSVKQPEPRKTKVFRSTELELVMKFAPDFKTRKLIISPCQQMSEFVALLQNNGSNPEVRVEVLPARTPPPPNMLLADFLNSKDQTELLITLNDSLSYTLKSKMLPYMDLHGRMHSDEPTSLYIMHGLTGKGVGDQSASTVSYYLDSVRQQLKQIGVVDEATFERILDDEHNKALEYCHEADIDIQMVKRRNKLESTLRSLEAERDSLFSAVSRKTSFYVAAILGLSLVQFGFFFYTIYMVDWLGWDIMEPITYSLEVVAYLVAIRFFYKYRTGRSFAEVERLFAKRYFARHPTQKMKLDSVNAKIESIQTELKLIKVFRQLNH